MKVFTFFFLFLAVSIDIAFGAGVPLNLNTTTGLFYQSQGPFPQDAKKCILGSFKVFKGLKDNAKAANESEFKQWKAACAKMAPCKHAASMKYEIRAQPNDNSFQMYECIPEKCLTGYDILQPSGCFVDEEKVNAEEEAREKAEQQKYEELDRRYKAIEDQVDAEFAEDERLEDELDRTQKQNDKLDKKCPRWTQINEKTQKCGHYEYQFKDNIFGTAPIKNFWLITKTDNVDPDELKKNQTEFTNWQNACKNTKQSNSAQSMIWKIRAKNQNGCTIYTCVPESCSKPDMIIRKPDADNGGYCILPEKKRDGAKCKPDDKNAKTGKYNASGECEITECKDKYTQKNGKCVKKATTQTENDPKQNNEQISDDKSETAKKFFADLKEIIDAFKTVIEKIKQTENNSFIDSGTSAPKDNKPENTTV